ncbi:MAG: DinB family protein [Planctomycetota bacterium]
MTDPRWRAGTRRLARRLAGGFRRIEERLGAPEEALRRSPGPGSWSAIEVAEHAALMNHHVLLLVEKIAARCEERLARGEHPPEEPSRFEVLEKLAAREFHWESPEHMVPGGHATAREIAASLREQRRRCLALLARMSDGEGALHSISMSVVGEKLDLYQYLTLVALHLERHGAQIDRALESA